MHRKIVFRSVWVALLLVTFAVTAAAAPPSEALSPEWAPHRSLALYSQSTYGGVARLGASIDAKVPAGLVPRRVRKIGEPALLPMRAEIEQAIRAPIPVKTARVVFDPTQRLLHVRIGSVVRTIHYEILGNVPITDALLAKASEPSIAQIRRWEMVDDIAIDPVAGTVVVSTDGQKTSFKLDDLEGPEAIDVLTTERVIQVEFRWV